MKGEASFEELIIHHENVVLPRMNSGDMWLVYTRVKSARKPRFAVILIASRPEGVNGPYDLVRSKLYLTPVEPNNVLSFQRAYFKLSKFAFEHTESERYFTPHLFTNIRNPLIYVNFLGNDPRWQ